jgi:phage-related protein
LNFDVLFLEGARDFLHAQDKKVSAKILFHVDKARHCHDPKLLKKLTREIWEFRTRFNHEQYRLLAFWDKRSSSITLVVVTHGFVKKTSKVDSLEIAKAERIRRQYFEQKKV